MTAPDIRDATPADRAAWDGLWQAYLAFYKVTLDPSVTDHTWARFFDPESRLTCRVAVVAGQVAGFAIHHWHESTWVAGADVYLEDLFVGPAQRGHGVGRALINDLRAIARTKGWHRVYWHTDQNNHRARALYDTFAPSDGHVRYRIAP